MPPSSRHTPRGTPVTHEPVSSLLCWCRFPVSAEPLEPGVSVSVGANVRKKKGFPIITLAGFKRCPEDPGAE